MKVKVKEHQPVKRSHKGAETFPMAFEHGVKIYRGERLKGGKTYPEFTVVWSQGGRRERRFFADLAEAKAEASLAVTRFANGQLDVLNLSGTDRETYMEARRRAEILKTPLLSILDQYEAATRKLGDKATLAEAADYWTRNCDQQITPRRLNVACDEMLGRRKAEGSSVAHLGTLKVYLGQISAAFPETMMEQVTQKDLTTFLHSGERTKLSARSRNNLRGTLTKETLS